jgi:2-amino-4-hydroxy-6-hydroxymethyldihydropteridine diphosphokinase
LGKDLEHMQFNPKKLPLANDVKIPLLELWQHEALNYDDKLQYPVIKI